MRLYLFNLTNFLIFNVELLKWPLTIGMRGFSKQKAFYVTDTMNVNRTIACIKSQKGEGSEFAFRRTIRKDGTHSQYRSTDREGLRNFLKSEQALMNFKDFSKNKTPNLMLPICQCHQMH